MANPDPLEKVIEKKVCDYAKTLGCFSYKFTSPMKRSVPDRMLIPKGKPAFFIEFKRRGQKPTPAQALEIQKIRDQGSTVFVVDNVEEGKRVVFNHLNLDNQLFPDFTPNPKLNAIIGDLWHDKKKYISTRVEDY